MSSADIIKQSHQPLAGQEAWPQIAWEAFLRDVNIRHLRAFTYVAKFQSLNRAAATVNLSQPALSQAIMGLETGFSTALFIRSATGMYPTEAGLILLGRVERAFEQLEDQIVPMLPRVDNYGNAVPEISTLLTLRQIGVLRMLQSKGSISECAKELGLTEKSVNRHIRNLEERLGCELLSRAAARAALTRLGESVCRAGGLFIREIETAHDEIALSQGRAQGRLVIGAMPLTRSYIVPRAMVVFATQAPGIRVELLEGAYATLLSGLCSGDIDLLVGALRDPVPDKSVVQHPLFHERLFVVARADHPCFDGNSDSLEALFRYPWVSPRKGSPARRSFETMLADVGSGPRVLLEAASHMAVRAILIESDCLALISRHQIRYEERSGQLRVVPVDVPQPDRVVGYTVRSNWQATTSHQAFIKELKNACEMSLK